VHSKNTGASCPERFSFGRFGRIWSNGRKEDQLCKTENSFLCNVVVVPECIYQPYVFSHLVAISSAECNFTAAPSVLDCGQLLTICDIVWRLPHGHMSVAARPSLLLTGCAVTLVGPEAIQEYPLVSGWSNPGCQIVGSSAREELTT